MSENITSLETFNLGNRGTVKIVKLDDIPRTYHIGEPIRIDGEDWKIAGVESCRPHRNDGLVGVVVRPL